MLSDNVTVCIFAFNEALRIERCIKNFAGKFKILIVDNCSVDNTRAVVESLRVPIVTIKNPNFIEAPEVMGPLWSHLDTEYMLIASCSEYIPLVLLHKYAEVANAVAFDVVRVFRESITAGLPIPISGLNNKSAQGELRFYRRGAVTYEGNKVHDRGRVLCVSDRVLSLTGNNAFTFYQFRDYDCAKTERNHANYNDTLALQWYQSGVRFSWSRALWGAFKQFANSYVRFGSWRFGMLGFIHSAYRFYMELGVWFRVWEWQHQYDGISVKRKNDEFRTHLEREL